LRKNKNWNYLFDALIVLSERLEKITIEMVMASPAKE
jgi:hypothetical protein